MEYEVRPIARGELGAFAKAQAFGFGQDYHPEWLEYREAVFEYERSLATFDGTNMVGTAGIFSYHMTVPGGDLPCAGVTMVSVSPTHRRRGLLTGMMRRQLEHIRERGEPIAALWASESLIYERFGYGLASQQANLSIERTRAALSHGADVRGTARPVEVEEARKTWPAIYDAARRQRPGMITRSPEWWDSRSLNDPEAMRGGFTAAIRIVYEESGEMQGYLRYRTKQQWEDMLADSTLAVQELVALTPAAYAGLWQYVFGVDLVGTIMANDRPMDDPLYWMLTDPRRLRHKPHDALWVRIVDIEAALSGRRYAREGRLRFEVDDAFWPEMAGRFELEGGPDGALCRRTNAEPELRLSAADLGGLYLGANGVEPLVMAGRATGEPQAVAKASAMFRWDPLPWCAEIF